MGPHECVHSRGRHALEFTELRQNVRRGRDIGVGHRFEHNGLRALFVRGPAIAVQEADRDTLDLALQERPDGRMNRSLVKLAEDLTIRPDAFGYFQSEIPRDEGRRFFDTVVVDGRSRLSAEFENVTKSPRRQQARPGTPALDHDICGNRRAMPEIGHAGGVDRVIREQVLQPLLNGVGRFVRRRGNFEEVDGAVRLVEHCEVGESAPDVHSDPISVSHLAR